MEVRCMRGRPVLGVIGGLLFGLGLAVFLQQAGVFGLEPLTLYGLPVVGVVLGLVLAGWAPLGKGDA